MEQKQESTHDHALHESEGAPSPVPLITKPTWVTWAAFFACIGIFIGVNLEETKSLEVLSRFGFFTAERIWEGLWWGTMSSTFVHINLIHAFFNLYWLWLLGRLMEDEIGSSRFLVFYLGASIVSSTVQLAVSDTTGIGASGVLYAIFGFMWRTRMVYPRFQSIIVPQTVKVFFIWLVACFFLTAGKLMNIANGAHLAGLVYGVVMAECFVVRRPRLPYAAGAVVLAGLALVPLWWAPWSPTWQGVKAYDAIEAGRREEAVERLTTMIRLEPQEPWAYLQRSKLYREMGESDKAVSDLRKAQDLGTPTRGGE
ncbi:GlpG protein [Roseimicrobium gellanilyticum]|uniref:GlpG protein n=1 Tax=Roseimicrobium gellanilyticum TaxID=748857 RepID=A0A366HEG9_9BACT|nr:rhomboid family intramembrane serine protease [Roseimicrobium gellanilyticum]RBP40450.1 GlpG protein [Roseimicrobium gellanilyticum]